MSASHLKSFLSLSRSIPYHLISLALSFNFLCGENNNPPSIEVICFIACNENMVKLPCVPILLPLYDDLNTPGYIANLHKLYENASKGNDEDKKIFNSACNFIGLLNETKEVWLNYKKDKADISEDEIKNKIDLRNKARADKDYKEADNIRDYLLDKGVLIEDKDGKTIWKFK